MRTQKLLRTVLFLFMLSSLTMPAIGQYSFEWGYVTGDDNYDPGGTQDSDAGKSLVIDNAGNLIVAGYFSDTVDFDHGPGVTELTAGSTTDIEIFVGKYTAGGDLIWVFGLNGAGGSNFDLPRRVLVDSDDNIYVSGVFYGVCDFDPGAGTSNLNGGSYGDAFIAKYTTDGQLLWCHNIGSTANVYDDFMYDMAIDNDDNVVVTGSFSGTADFQPGAGSTTLSSYGAAYDVFLAKYTPAGTLDWAFRLGKNMYELPNCLAIDDNNDIYLSGEFSSDTLFVNPASPGDYLLNTQSEGFTASYDEDGNYLDAMTLSGDDIVVSNANVYLLRNITASEGTLDLDRGGGTFNVTTTSTAGNYSFIVARYNTAFNFADGFIVNNTNNSAGVELVVESGGDFWVTGDYAGTVDLNPGAGSASYTSSGANNDAFYAKYSASYAYMESFVNSGFGFTGVDDVFFDDYGNIYSTGYFQDILELDPFTSSEEVFSLNNYSMILMRYSVPCAAPTAAVLSSANVEVCTGDDVTLTVTGGNLNDADEWVWYEDACGGTIVGTGNSITISPAVNATYYVRGEGCNVPGTCVAATVTVNNLPTVTLPGFTDPLICNGAAVALPAGTPAGGNYSGPGVGGGNFNSNTAGGVGNYTVTYTYTDGNGCTNSNQSGIEVTDCAGLIENNGAFTVTAYPNPTDGLITIVGDGREMIIRVLTLGGAVVLETQCVDAAAVIDLGEQGDGLYLVEILTATERYHTLITKQ